MASFKWDKTGLFAAGVLFGTAGIKLLSSKDAKKVYTECTAAVLRAKDCVMKTVTTVQENAGDIYADAQQINEDRKAAEEPFEDETAEGETEFKETDEAEEAETEEAADQSGSVIPCKHLGDCRFCDSPLNRCCSFEKLCEIFW